MLYPDVLDGYEIIKYIDNWPLGPLLNNFPSIFLDPACFENNPAKFIYFSSDEKSACAAICDKMGLIGYQVH